MTIFLLGQEQVSVAQSLVLMFTACEAFVQDLVLKSYRAVVRSR